MSQRSNPTLIGVFVFGAMLLILAGVLLLTGSSYFTQKTRYVMYFEGSVYGLQVGAPVVFRGVQIGSVQHIDLRYDAGSRQLVIPVVVEETPRIRDLSDHSVQNVLPAPSDLVKQGLRAQLATQSLLTGQLYIELDFHPEREAIFRAPKEGLPEIPTIPSPVQEIANKLKQADLEGLINNIAEIADSTRNLVNSPELAESLRNLNVTIQHLKSLSTKFDERFDPMARNLDAAMSSVTHNMNAMGAAADKLSGAVDDSKAPMVSLRLMADELTRTAGTLNELAGEGAPALYNANQTLKELRETAHALQDLSDTLERQPNSLLFGKQPSPLKEHAK